MTSALSTYPSLSLVAFVFLDRGVVHPIPFSRFGMDRGEDAFSRGERFPSTALVCPSGGSQGKGESKNTEQKKKRRKESKRKGSPIRHVSAGRGWNIAAVAGN